jgi:hypothetical protein
MTKIEHLPAWSLLTPTGIAGLLARPNGGPPETIRLGCNLDETSAAGMPLLATLSLMLTRAQASGGLTLTTTHALSRADTRALFDCPPSALLRQIEGLHERRMAGSS